MSRDPGARGRATATPPQTRPRPRVVRVISRPFRVIGMGGNIRDTPAAADGVPETITLSNTISPESTLFTSRRPASAPARSADGLRTRAAHLQGMNTSPSVAATPECRGLRLFTSEAPVVVRDDTRTSVSMSPGEPRGRGSPAGSGHPGSGPGGSRRLTSPEAQGVSRCSRRS